MNRGQLAGLPRPINLRNITIGVAGTNTIRVLIGCFGERVVGPEGRYYAEIVVPLVLVKRRAVAAEGSRVGAVADVASFPATGGGMARMPRPSLKPPGSDWLYLKIYSGLTLHDDLIAGPLREFCEFVLKERLAERWFFVRYADPDPHIRVRYQGDPSVLTRHLLPAVCDWASQLLAKGHCKHFAFDTYDREIERYGGMEGIDVAEAVFSADSVAVVNFKNLVAQRAMALNKENLAVLTVDNLLDGLSLSELDRTTWLRGIVTRRAEVGVEYRKRQGFLRPQLWAARTRDVSVLDDPLKAALRAARDALAASGERLADLALRSRLSQPAASLFGSLVHMHCNRFLGLDRSAESRVLSLLLRTSDSLREAPLS